MSKIRKNDTVMVMRGSCAGKSGKVLEVIPWKGRALVEGVNVVKRHMRKSQEHPNGAIAEKEASLVLSGLKLYCPGCKKGVRTSLGKEGDKRIRKCKKCGHHFDS